MDIETIKIEWDEVFDRIHQNFPLTGHCYGVPRGGAIVSGLTHRIAHSSNTADFIVDDIIDSGRTKAFWEKNTQKPFYSLVDKKKEKIKGWVQFPWERDDTHDAEENIVRLLQAIGEDPTRDGLRETPKRVIKAWREMTAGIQMNPKEILSKEFDIQDEEMKPYDQMILSGAVPFSSNCEHHMMPFYGHAYVGYLPSKKGTVVGLSKLARVVDAYALRLQVQERMTQQIANVVHAVLRPRGTAVVIKAKHTCQCHRGIKKDGHMVTSAMYGMFRKNETKKEFFSLMSL